MAEIVVVVVVVVVVVEVVVVVVAVAAAAAGGGGGVKDEKKEEEPRSNLIQNLETPLGQAGWNPSISRLQTSLNPHRICRF